MIDESEWRWIGREKPYTEWLFYSIYEDRHYTIFEMIPKILGFMM